MDLAVERLTSATLVRVNRSTDQLEPWLAESWTTSPDNLIYTVRLRPGLTAADGTALTASRAAQSLGNITVLEKPVAVRAVDPLALEVRFASPFAPGLRVLDRHPIAGFGPFVESPGKRPGIRTFTRNAKYWRKAANGSALPYLDEIVLMEDARLKSRPTARLKSSPTTGPSPTAGPTPTNITADFADVPTAAEDFEAIKKLEQSGKARLFELGPGLDADALWISDSPPQADERPWLTSEVFRLAISTAVDRREYCKQVFYGACDPMAGPVSPANVMWFNPDLPLGQGNPQLARAKLGELGLRDRTGDGLLDDAMRRPLRFTLLIRRDVPSAARAATFLTATLKSIGVRVDVMPVDAETLAARRDKGNYDAIYDRVEFHDTDPAMNLDFWLGFGTSDWARQMRELILKNATTFDRIERLQAFVDAQKIYLQHMPAIFFGTPHVRVTTSLRTLNATPSPLRPHILWNAENLAALK
jgi:peptide/nickel transport system substrate-binding protein